MDLILLLKIIFLSFVQGVSEFFPISSSGHLVLFQELIGFRQIPLVYDIFFHIGTLVSVLVFFYKDIVSLVTGVRKKENLEFITLLIIASIPTALIGFFFKDQLEALFHRPELVGIFLIVSAFFIFLSRFVRVGLENQYAAALIIGTFQGLAIIPGLSRSGLTISMGLILTMGFMFSFRFSFLLSIPAITGALILEFSKIPFTGVQFPYLLAGAVFSAMFGLAALVLLKKIILREKFHYFSYYCLFAGVLALTIFN